MSVKVNCLNPIAKCGLDLLDDNYEMVDDAAQAGGDFGSKCFHA